MTTKFAANRDLLGRCITGPATTLALLFCLGLAAGPPLAGAAQNDCAQPKTNGNGPTAADALVILKVAVGIGSCELCVCDVNGNGGIQASDALATLKKAVGLSIALLCPACQPSLTGIVSFADPQSMQSTASVVAGPPAALVGGLVPVSGATVEAFALDAEGTPIPPALATATSKADGSYRLSPVPEAGSQTMVRATKGQQVLRAFVTSAVADIDPVTEFVLARAVAAVQESGPTHLDALTIAEIDALTGLVRRSDIDLAGAASNEAAITLLDEGTGGVYAELIAEFATGGGPPVSIAGSYNLLQYSLAQEKSFQPISGQTPSVNERSVQVSAILGPLTISGTGTATTGAAEGARATLAETSGSTPNNQGPDPAINASALLSSGALNEAGGDPSQLLAGPKGGLLLVQGEAVRAGASVVGASMAIVTAGDDEVDAAGRGVAFALRQGSGLSNSSLSGTYHVVQFEVELQANSSTHDVHRSYLARNTSGDVVFDGSGGFSLGEFAGGEAALSKDGPAPADPPQDPTVDLGEQDVTEPASAGLSYALSATGSLTISDGDTAVAHGGVTPDRNVVVLHFGDADSDSGAVGFLVGVKRGSGMNNASGNGVYRTVSLRVPLQHMQSQGTVDATPDTNNRSVGASHNVGSFTLDGAGGLTIYGNVESQSVLSESSQVQRHSSAPSDVFDAGVSIFANTYGDYADPPQTATYSISSKGLVTAVSPDGTFHGFLSADGNVFLLPLSDAEGDTELSREFMIGLRQP